jgi:endonuclease YncB( thermonuclease family)
MKGPADFDEWPAVLECGYGPFRAVVQYIVDGDTFRALLSVGLNSYEFRTIRILDIDTPETNRPESKEAGLAAKARLTELMPPGEPVLIRTKPDPDSFGRYLGSVRTEAEFDIGAVLLREGFAVPYVR